MDAKTPSRREFLSSSAAMLSGGWAVLNMGVLASLAACSRQAATTGEPFTTLTVGEGRAMRACAARIIPSDDGPGAEEAGAAWFVDRALGSFFEDMLAPMRAGLADLDARAGAAHAGSRFADLDAAAQDDIVRAVEQTDFFGLARMLVVIGTFADPSYGGNRQATGWAILRVDHKAAYQPPFGHYDAEYSAAANGGAS